MPVADPDLAAVFTALADPTRRRVFEELAKGPSPVGRLAGGLPVSRPAVSQHLKVLLDVGLVDARAEGNRRVYAARPEGLMALRGWVEGMWRDALTAFAAAVEDDTRKDRT